MIPLSRDRIRQVYFIFNTIVFQIAFFYVPMKMVGYVITINPLKMAPSAHSNVFSESHNVKMLDKVENKFH